MKLPKYISPIACSPPHRVTHPDKRNELLKEFKRNGWDSKKPYLVGYPFLGSIQLLNGSHRWSAALLADIKIPVYVYSYEYVKSVWGDLEKWKDLLND